MILISHRGNISGPNPEQENVPDYILQALGNGFDVEVDVWYKEQRWFLGHDRPEHLIDAQFLENEKIWCHAKNLDALYCLSQLRVTYFWHENDAATLTSNGYIWTYPGKKLTPLSISVLPEQSNIWSEEIAGVCSDYIERYNA